MALLEEVKVANRITTDDAGITSELEGLIEAAKIDLQISGVSKEKSEDVTDPLIKRAVILYTKAHFGFGNPESERLEAVYYSLKQHLALAGDYNAVE